MTTTQAKDETAGGAPGTAPTCCCAFCALARTLQIENLIGPEAARHLRQSQKEVLLAVRSALDAAIENLEAKSEPRRAEKIAVE